MITYTIKHEDCVYKIYRRIQFGKQKCEVPAGTYNTLQDCMGFMKSVLGHVGTDEDKEDNEIFLEDPMYFRGKDYLWGVDSTVDESYYVHIDDSCPTRQELEEYEDSLAREDNRQMISDYYHSVKV